MELPKESCIISVMGILYDMDTLAFKCDAHARGVSVEQAAAEKIVAMFCTNLLTPAQENS